MIDLQKIIYKAVNGGFHLKWDYEITNVEMCEHGEGFFAGEGDNSHYYQLDETVFSHDFLISIYGKELICILDGGKLAGEGKRTQCMVCNRFERETEFIPMWKYHGMRLVWEKSENRLQYLYNTIDWRRKI